MGFVQICIICNNCTQTELFIEVINDILKTGRDMMTID